MRYVQLKVINIKLIYDAISILHRAGEAMAKEGLHHWDNSLIKTVAIFIYFFIKNEVYVAIKEGNVVGTFQIKKRNKIWTIEKLAISPELTAHGYGSDCLNYIFDKAAEGNIQAINIEVYDKSKRAINFYIKKGFEVINYRNSLKYRTVIMEKKINE